MRANKIDGCPSNSCLTLLICLKYSDNDIGVDYVLRGVLYEAGNSLDLISVVFDSCLVYQA